MTCQVKVEKLQTLLTFVSWWISGLQSGPNKNKKKKKMKKIENKEKDLLLSKLVPGLGERTHISGHTL